MKIPFLIGKKIYLRPLLQSDVGEKYLGWLNDPEINEYSRRRQFPTTEPGLQSYFDQMGKSSNTIVLAIIVKENDLHVGNIQLGPIQWVPRMAEIAVLMGDKEWWNKGVGAEAMELVARHAFQTLNLHRLYAGTTNPAFKRLMEKLEWTLEGTFRDAGFINGKYVDSYFFGTIKPSE